MSADWLKPFASLPDRGYRSPDVQKKIHDLAVKIVTDAHATNPYDQATAIQNYLRDSTNYKYTLTPKSAPAARDKIVAHLNEFVSRLPTKPGS